MSWFGGAGDAFAVVALKPPHLQAAALGRKHCLPLPLFGQQEGTLLLLLLWKGNVVAGLWEVETGPRKWNCSRYLGVSCDLLVTLRTGKGWVGRLHSEAPATWGWSHVSSVGQSYCFLASGQFPVLPYVNQDTNQTKRRGCLRSWEHTFSLEHF